MPRLRMPQAQQAIFDELSDYLDDGRMISAPKLAQFWGRDVRCVRAWLHEQKLPKYQMGNGYGYMIRDVSRAMYYCEVSA